MADSLPSMNWNSPNVPEAFQLFKQKVKLYFSIKKISGAAEVPYILRGVDDEGLRRYNSWSLTEDQKKNPEHIWKCFEAQLEPDVNFRVARLQLHYYYQRQDESLDNFVTRCRQLATKCKFGAEIDERIMEQIIASTPIQEFQKELLDQAQGYTLEDCLTLGRTYEARQHSMQELSRMNTSTAGALSGATATVGAISKSKTYKHCKFCGREHGRRPTDCHAYYSTCSACGQQGHWKKYCKAQGKPHNQDSGGRGKHQDTGGRGNRGRGNRGRGRSRGRGRGQPRHSDERQIHELEEDFDNMTFESIQVSTCSMTDASDDPEDRNEAFALLDIDLARKDSVRYNIKLKVDTGAQGNTLPLRIFRRMYPEKLDDAGLPKKIDKEAGVKLTAYNGSRIPCLGSVIIPCRYESPDWTSTKFYVVDVPGHAVIGLPSCTKLGLVTLHCNMDVKTGNVTPNKPAKIDSVDDLKRLYPQQFDRIGSLPGEAKLSLRDGSEPYVDAPRKWPIHLKDKIKAQLDKMVDQGVIRPIKEHSDWCSSLAFSTKSDGSIRICLDPAKLNKALKRCPHKIPTLEELNYKFNKAKYFSKLDAKAGYWSVKLDDTSQPLTTFRTPYGRYCFLRLPFGLSVSQDIYQQRMDAILEECDGATGIADDVAVYGETEDEHDKHLVQLMEVAARNGLVFNSSKCQIKQRQISFFGMVYGADGIQPDQKKVEDIQNMPSPTRQKEVQEFLGLVQYLSPFIPNLSKKAEVLRNLTKKDVPFTWDVEHQQCFDNLKALVTADAALQYYDVNATTVLQVDASQRGLGAALMQVDSQGREKPIAYASKALSGPETRYANIERELLAVCFGVERFKTFLYGRRFKVITDHKPLPMILEKNLTAAPPRLQRMILRLQGYDFKLEYRPGSEMSLPDSLSRLPNPHNKEPLDLDVRVDLVQFSVDKLSDIRENTRLDPVLSELSELIVMGWPDSIKSVPTDLRGYWNYRDELSIEDGVILKGERVLIPECLRSGILQRLHTGHLGMEKTRLRARNAVYWPNIQADIDKMCKACETCQEFQPAQQRETLMPHDVPTGPWKVVGTDLFEFDGDNYLMIADYYSKFVFTRKLPIPSPSNVVIALTKQIFAEHGIPRRVISDNGPHFSSYAYKNFAETWEFEHVTSSPHYPRSNGFVERQIQTVKSIMKKCKRSGDDPELALLTLRTTPVDSKLPSPAELLYSRKIRANLPTHVHYHNPEHDQFGEQLVNRQLTQKYYNDLHAKDHPPLYVGQKVTIRNPTTGHWIPSVVQSKCEEPRSYLVQSPNGGTVRRNRCQIRETPKSSTITNQPSNSAKTVANVVPEPSQADRVDTASGAKMTRTGRIIQTPARFRE